MEFRMTSKHSNNTATPSISDPNNMLICVCLYPCLYVENKTKKSHIFFGIWDSDQFKHQSFNFVFEYLAVPWCIPACAAHRVNYEIMLSTGIAKVLDNVVTEGHPFKGLTTWKNANVPGLLLTLVQEGIDITGLWRHQMVKYYAARVTLTLLCVNCVDCVCASRCILCTHLQAPCFQARLKRPHASLIS